MNMLDVALMEYISRVESKTIDLILAGVDPKKAKQEAITIISKRRREKNADKNKERASDA